MFFFVFKQKTAYEMRISDWSSDVCSSDLLVGLRPDAPAALQVGSPQQFHGIAVSLVGRQGQQPQAALDIGRKAADAGLDQGIAEEIGRASCRERVCRYV